MKPWLVFYSLHFLKQLRGVCGHGKVGNWALLFRGGETSASLRVVLDLLIEAIGNI
jgi:hypothetical protein